MEVEGGDIMVKVAARNLEHQAQKREVWKKIYKWRKEGLV